MTGRASASLAAWKRIKASRATTFVLDLSGVTKFTSSMLKTLAAALPAELEELDLQLAGSSAEKEEALITALLKRVAGFANVRSIAFDGFKPKHASLLKKAKTLQQIPTAVFPKIEARLAVLDELPNLKHVDLSGLSADLAPRAAEAIAKLQKLETVNKCARHVRSLS